MKMSKEIQHRRQDVIAEEAAGWFMALQDADSSSKERFTAWLKTSPEHVNEFLAVAALWDALPEVSSQPSIEELIALAESDANVVALSGPGSLAPTVPPNAPEREHGSKTRKVWVGLAAAATVAAILIGGALTLLPPPVDPNLYTTAIGEQTSLPLADGSLVTLNTQSKLRVEYSEAYRDIYLNQGEALFDVAKDTERPFRVITEYAVVTAVGTQFNVRSDADDVTVTVVEGIVDVARPSSVTSSGSGAQLPATSSAGSLTPVVSEPTRLRVGQQARVDVRSGEVAVVDTAVETATAWQQRRLVFDSLSLKEVIDEFNRYNDPPLLIDDRSLEILPISGVFRSNDRESFVAFLAQMQLAEAHTRTDGTIMLRDVTDED